MQQSGRSRGRSGGAGDGYARMRRLERERKRRKRVLILRTCLVVFLLCMAGIIVVIGKGAGKKKDEEALLAESNPVIENKVTVNDISIKGMKRDEALQVILENTPWTMEVVCENDRYSVTNLFQIQLEKLLDEICFEDGSGEFMVDMEHLEELAAKEADVCKEKWDEPPKNSGPESFDKVSGTFVFSESQPGMVIDHQKLQAEILEAVRNKDYDAVIFAEREQVPAEITKETAKKTYKTLASFTTETTDNAKRNINVRLSAEALNGTIIQPGEEFSFNQVVGQRTAEKGYQAAAAYNSGEVVQEVGGGVCQMSSTLYRVAFQSGMEISFRRSHTFEPNYVTPGQDATISWEQPDFRFINTSKGPIGIRASYSDRKASVSIYGIPVLEEGITWDLYSEKVEEMELPPPVYEEDPTLEPGQEVLKKAGTKGNRWVTYKVVYKDGKEIERVEDHAKTYKGHAPVIRRNTTNVSPSQSGVESTAETIMESIVDGMEEDMVSSSESRETTETKPETRPSREETPESAKPETESSKSETKPSREETLAATKPETQETKPAAKPSKTEETPAEIPQVPVLETISPKPED